MFSFELYIKSMLLMPPFLLHNKKTISFSAMVATIMDKSQESYLGQQLQQANQALEAAAKEVNTSKEQAFQYYSDVETAVQDVELTIHTLVQNRIDQVLTQARKECIGLGLSLRPLFINQKFVIMLWIGLILVIPFLLGFLISSKFLCYLIAIGLYVFLSKKSIQIAATKKSQNTIDAIQSLKQYSFSFMHFTEKESGDSAYPYDVVRAPWPNKDVFSSWRINNEFGPLFGADFIVFHPLNMPIDSENIHMVLSMPKNDRKAALIPIKAGAIQQSIWSIQKAFLQEVASKLENYVKPIQVFSEYAEIWAKDHKYYNTLQQRLKTLSTVVEEWSDIAIKEETLDRILKIVDLFISDRKPTPKGILLYGPPGTGKTLIARKLQKHANCHFEAVNISDLKAGYTGQTAPKVKALWQRCRDNAPTILFIDECESTFARRGGVDTDAFGNELVQTFLSEWDGFNQDAGKVFVVAATNRKDLIDNAILSRFTTTIEIGLPDGKARKRILENEFAQADMQFKVNDDIVHETAGMSGRDLHTLIASLVAESLNRDLNADMLLEHIRKIRGKGSTNVKAMTWDDIVLPNSTMSEFQNLGKELRNAEKLAELGISIPKGILLYGPPGTGKTQIARVLASQSGLSFIGATTSDLKANYIGQSGSKVKQLFEQARSQAPCILFIDEIDIVAGARNGSNDSFIQEIVGQMLQELDGIATKEGQVFLLAASNYPENIDSALMSRLERKIEIGLPNEFARSQIIANILRKKPTNFDVETIAIQLAKQTENYSGRDLNSLITRATRHAVNRALQTGDDIENTKIIEQDLFNNIETVL